MRQYCLSLLTLGCGFALFGCGVGDESGPTGGVDWLDSAVVESDSQVAHRGLRAAFIEARQRQAGPAYGLTAMAMGHDARNSAHGMSLRFDGQSVVLADIAGPGQGPGWQLELRYQGIGRATASGLASLARTPVEHVAVAGNKLRYRRASGVVEWYLNGPLGLEQILCRPAAWCRR